MTVKELINELLDCNMNAEVRLCDDVKFVDEHAGICVGSLYHIDEVKKNGDSLCELHFDNRHHFAKESKWIPVSEKLPEVGSDVLATYIEDDEIKVGITYYSKRGFYINTTIAWMPLPEPYKTESEETDADCN